MIGIGNIGGTDSPRGDYRRANTMSSKVQFLYILFLFFCFFLEMCAVALFGPQSCDEITSLLYAVALSQAECAC